MYVYIILWIDRAWEQSQITSVVYSQEDNEPPKLIVWFRDNDTDNLIARYARV